MPEHTTTIELTDSERLVLLYALADLHHLTNIRSSAREVLAERDMRWQDISDKLLAPEHGR